MLERTKVDYTFFARIAVNGSLPLALTLSLSLSISFSLLRSLFFCYACVALKQVCQLFWQLSRLQKKKERKLNQVTSDFWLKSA